MDIYLEIGSTRVFAGAIEWPGLSRAGKTEATALEAVLAHGPRYALVVADVDRSFRAPAGLAELRIRERLDGDATTDFGAPSQAPALDREALDEPGLARQLGILRAAWAAFDRVAAAAEGVELKKGPRGGGRTLEKIRSHVVEAEEGYLRVLGARPPDGTGPNPQGLAVLRDAVAEVLTARALDRPLENPTQTKRKWLPRFFVRRAAWHVLDHAWEIENRAPPEANG